MVVVFILVFLVNWFLMWYLVMFLGLFLVFFVDGVGKDEVRSYWVIGSCNFIGLS